MIFFNKTIIRTKEAQGLFNFMTELVRSYGPPRAPKIPSPLRPAPKLTDIYKDRSNHQPDQIWADENFARFKQNCGMENWPIQIGRDIATKNHSNNAQQKPALYSLIQPYFQSGDTGTAIGFEPGRCHIPGYFAASSLLKLSELRWRASAAAAITNPMQEAIMTLTCAAYCGQGFHLLPVSKMIQSQLSAQTSNAPLSKSRVQNTLLFTACLGLRALNRSPEQIIAAYGCLISSNKRQKIMQICEQIDGLKSELALLRHLCAPQRRNTSSAWRANVA